MRKGIIAGFVAVVLAILAFRFGSSTGQQSSSKTTSPQSPEVGSTKDMKGERRVEALYKTPAGEDAVAFRILVDDSGTITRADTEALARNDVSKTFQEKFSQGLPLVLVGRKLSDLSAIDIVGGASLTTKAFNNALEKLKS